MAKPWSFRPDPATDHFTSTFSKVCRRASSGLVTACVTITMASRLSVSLTERADIYDQRLPECQTVSVDSDFPAISQTCPITQRSRA